MNRGKMKPEQEHSGFTPGPWAVGQKSKYGTHNACNIYVGEKAIASVFGISINRDLEEEMKDGRSKVGLANAKLIAAAPDLLAENQRLRRVNAGLVEACQEILATAGDSIKMRAWAKCYTIAKAALKAAEEK